MIEAKELRIGNWVFNKARERKQLKEVYADCSVYDPIPITEEWLVKFGFRRVEKENSPFEDMDYPYMAKEGVIILVNKTSETNICFKAGFGEMRCGNYHLTLSMWVNSVHQLQNLYFALTGTEL